MDKPVFIAGPCVIESAELLDTVAQELVRINQKYGIDIIFKASFDKANRTSLKSFRGPGLEKGLEMLADIKSRYGLRILTDIHEAWQADPVGKVADVIVCDGFVGNTLLKTVEGLFRINKALKIPETPFWRDMNYEYVGGTPVLGVNAPVVIGHGCSSALAIKNMILTTERCAQTGVTAKLQNAFKN